ncbi:hypothetical protein [Absidia glauca]|uniref:ACB domain-containing protein n=1 Tax=Absidia glauca TaxID=4829 RepID=A0A168MGE2_ABSGL|nr:hypothetical protein [Absidia glauca]
MSTLPHIIHARFQRALTVVHSLPQDEVGLQPIPTDRLKFYGLYKQATLGECNTQKPSSRKVVDYAKWKAWYRVRHLSCMEAQNLYVNALVELLVEFIHRYPSNQYNGFAKEALQSLESDLSAGSEEVEHYAWEPTLDSANPLTYIEPHDLTNYTHLVTSPTATHFTPTNGSLISASPSLFASSTTTTTQQDPRTPPPQQQQYYHHQKQATIPSPPMEVVRTSFSSSSSSLSSPSSPHISHEQTLETLQTQVAALTEQMDRVRLEVSYPANKRGFLGRLLLVLVKHVLANTLMATLLFVVLLYRRSPVALALADYLTLRSRTLLRSLIRSTVKKVMFWKLTV